MKLRAVISDSSCERARADQTQAAHGRGTPASKSQGADEAAGVFAMSHTLGALKIDSQHTQQSSPGDSTSRILA
jgi:hypothetical protein